MSEATKTSARSIVEGAISAGVDACVYLPDSGLTKIIKEFKSVSSMTVIPCAREDEGIAIAVGLQLGGRRTICLMEASGLGYSGLILARAQMQRTPVVIVASHTRGGGEPFDYHGATVLVSEGIFRGLNIPYEIASDRTRLDLAVRRVFETAQGQRTCFGFLLPPYITSEFVK